MVQDGLHLVGLHVLEHVAAVDDVEARVLERELLAAAGPVVDLEAAGCQLAALSGAADRIAAHSPHASIDGVRSTLAAMGKSPAEVDRIIASQLAPKEA